MKKTNRFPKNPLAVFTLMDKIIGTIKPEKTFIESAIQLAYDNKEPYALIIRNLQTQMVDNPKMAAEIFGQQLWDEIREFQ